MFELVLPSVIAGYFGLSLVSFIVRQSTSTESEG
jgi:hypothetical protein